jgi:B12-binding domain/radical SAM domain protein
VSATLILAYRHPGQYAFNVLLGALEAVEDEGGLDVVVARNRKALFDETQRSLDAGQRTLVAWSFYSASLAECAAELAWLRNAVAQPFTSLAGGVHATAEPLETLRAGFDRVAIGEGEHTLRAIARAWRDGRSLDEIAGLARLVDGELATRGRATPVAHLDEFPAFSARKRRFGSIEITRGCIYACKFCQTPFVQKARFRHRSAENVAHWAAELRRAELRDVRFISPTSLSYGSDDESVNLAAVEDLLARVRAAMGRDGRVFFGTFPSEVRPEHVTHEALAVLKKYVDNDNLVIGGQSGSERILTSSHRGHGVEAIERAVRIALEAGFRPNVDFLLGLPGETRADVDATVALIERLSSLGARAHGHTFMPLPGTPFRNAPPGAIDASTEARLSALEGAGRLYGQWKRQMSTARELAERRVRRSNRRGDALSS